MSDEKEKDMKDQKMIKVVHKDGTIEEKPYVPNTKKRRVSKENHSFSRRKNG